MTRLHPSSPLKSLLLFFSHCLPFICLCLCLSSLRAQATSESIPDLQCVYAEAELTSIFMDRNPDRYLDEQTVELLNESCGSPTPKAELIYLYIRSAVAMRRYEGTRPAALSESLEYYRIILAQQHHLADIAQVDPDFVREYRYQLAELARHVEANYIETFAYNLPETNSRGQADYGISRGGYPEMNTRGQADYEISRGGYPEVNTRGQNDYAIYRGSHPVVPATNVQLLPGRQESRGATSATYTDWGQSRGETAATSANARVQQSVTRSLTPAEAYSMRTRQSLRSAEDRYVGYRQLSGARDLR